MTEQELAAIRTRLNTLMQAIRALCLAAHTRPADDYRYISREILALTAAHDTVLDDIPALLDEIDRLQRELTTTKAHNRDLMEAYNGLREQARGYRL